MDRPDFELAILELDAVASDVTGKLPVATQVSETIGQLAREGHPEFKVFLHIPLPDSAIAAILVAHAYLTDGKPKRWFQSEEGD